MKDDRGELDLTRQIDELKKKNDSTLDLSLLIDQHRREIHRYKMKESEWIRTKNQLDGNKKIIEELSAQIIGLKKEIDRLSEENNNIRTIDSSHKSLNGELRSENKHLKEKIAAYQEQLRKLGL